MIFQFCQLWVAVNRQRASMTHSADNFHWIWTSSGRYSVKTAYQAFFEGLTRLPGAEQLWKSAAPLRQKFFGWLAIQNRCWTADRLQNRGLPHQPMCTLCLQEQETMNHLLMQCPFSRTIWSLVTVPLKIAIACPQRDSVLVPWWEAVVANCPGEQRKEISAIITLIMFSIWKERNRRTFDNISTTDNALAGKIIAEWKLWKLAWDMKRASVGIVGDHET